MMVGSVSVLSQTRYQDLRHDVPWDEPYISEKTRDAFWKINQAVRAYNRSHTGFSKNWNRWVKTTELTKDEWAFVRFHNWYLIAMSEALVEALDEWQRERFRLDNTVQVGKGVGVSSLKVSKLAHQLRLISGGVKTRSEILKKMIKPCRNKKLRKLWDKVHKNMLRLQSALKKAY